VQQPQLARDRVENFGPDFSERLRAATPVPFWSASFVAPLVAATALLTVGAFVLSPYGLTIGAQIGIFAIVILGLNVLVGYAGQISFGHNAFMGLGAYLSALATVRWGLPPVVGLLIGVVAAALLGLVVGYPTLRLRGHYLALATFGVGLAFYNFAVSSPIFGGYMGIAGIPPFSIFGYSFATVQQRYLLVWATTLFAAVVAWRLRQLRFGRALRSIAMDESTAQAIGVDVQRYKVVAFVVSAVYGAVGGSLYAHTMRFVSPESFGFAVIVLLFVMLFIGGLGTVWGSILGAGIGLALPDLLADLEGWNPTIFALVILFIIIARPVGLLAPLSKNTKRRLAAQIPFLQRAKS
jgi:branched-chain amino acid transport system permease protein